MTHVAKLFISSLARHGRDLNNHSSRRISCFTLSNMQQASSDKGLADLFKGTTDSYKGVTVKSQEEPCSPDAFKEKLQQSLAHWKSTVGDLPSCYVH